MARNPYSVIDLYLKNPNISNKELRKQTGYSKRHIRRLLAPYRNTSEYQKSYDPDQKRLPKILLLDIETALALAWCWGPSYNTNILPSDIKEQWHIICFAAKWLLDGDIFGVSITSEEAINRDDRRVVKALWNLMEEADIIIAQNGDKFDIRKINARLLTHGYGPPAPFQTIDTLKQSKKIQSPGSHKLDELAKQFKLPRKKSTGHQLWEDCSAGDQEALDYMFEYCKQDIDTLEAVYLYIRPWMRSHPTLSLYCDNDTLICEHCMSEALETDIGYYTTMASRFPAYRCKNCGAINRGRFTSVSKEKRKKFIISTAR